MSSKDMMSAPMAGDARSKPSPSGPVCKMSLAEMGNSAVAPPSNTANNSQEGAPSNTLRCHTNAMPAITVDQLAAMWVG